MLVFLSLESQKVPITLWRYKKETRTVFPYYAWNYSSGWNDTKVKSLWTLIFLDESVSQGIWYKPINGT